MRAMWIGFAFFMGIMILGFATLMIQDVRLPGMERPIVLYVGLDQALGLEKGDNVRVDGIPMGKVRFVGLFDRRFRERLLESGEVTESDLADLEAIRRQSGFRSQGVAVIAELERSVELRKDARVSVEGLALIGGAYLSIESGSVDQPVRDLSRFRERVLVGHANKGFLEEGSAFLRKNQPAVERILANVEEVTANLKKITAEAGKVPLNKHIEEVKADLRRPLDEATAAMKKLSEAMEELKGTVREVHTVVRKASEGGGSLAKILNDPELHDEIVDTVREARAAIQEVRGGGGLLSRLATDRTLADQFSETVTSIRNAAASLDKVLKSIETGWLPKLMQDEQIGDNLKNSVSGLQKTVGRIGNARSFLGVEALSFNKTQVTVSRASVDLWPTEDKLIRLGAAFMDLDADGEILFKNKVSTGGDQRETRFEVQLGYRIPWFRPLMFRAGLIEGQPGAGLDVGFAVAGWPVQIGLEGRRAFSDLNEDDIDEGLDRGVLFRSYVRAPLYPKKGDGWFWDVLNALRLTVGVSRLFEDEEFFAGIGVYYEEIDVRSMAGLAGGP